MTEAQQRSKLSKIARWTGLFLILGTLYVVTAVPVGLFLYSLKSDIGLNIFSKTGYHSYMRCLKQEAYKAAILEKKQN